MPGADQPGRDQSSCKGQNADHFFQISSITLRLQTRGAHPAIEVFFNTESAGLGNNPMVVLNGINLKVKDRTNRRSNEGILSGRIQCEMPSSYASIWHEIR